MCRFDDLKNEREKLLKDLKNNKKSLISSENSHSDHFADGLSTTSALFTTTAFAAMHISKRLKEFDEAINFEEKNRTPENGDVRCKCGGVIEKERIEILPETQICAKCAK